MDHYLFYGAQMCCIIVDAYFCFSPFVIGFQFYFVEINDSVVVGKKYTHH